VRCYGGPNIYNVIPIMQCDNMHDVSNATENNFIICINIGSCSCIATSNKNHTVISHIDMHITIEYNCSNFMYII
jgi:hypothetical protein